MLAWALVRGHLPGRHVANALIDLPLALPTAVSGITLATLYSPNGWLGEPLSRLGIFVSYNRLGIVVALMFVGLPFMVRAIEPVLRDLPHELEEAAKLLGAKPWQVFTRVIVAPLLPLLLRGSVWPSRGGSGNMARSFSSQAISLSGARLHLC